MRQVTCGCNCLTKCEVFVKPDGKEARSPLDGMLPLVDRLALWAASIEESTKVCAANHELFMTVRTRSVSASQTDSTSSGRRES